MFKNRLQLFSAYKIDETNKLQRPLLLLVLDQVSLPIYLERLGIILPKRTVMHVATVLISLNSPL